MGFSAPLFPDKNPDKAVAILAGALEVFSTQGYAAASMDRIAKAARVSKPTLYKYFQDKEGLFLALTRQLTQRNKAQLPQLLMSADAKKSPEKVLRQIATFAIDDFSYDQALVRLMRLIIGESERFPHIAQAFVREIKQPMLENIAQYLASQPQLQLADPMVAARVFVGSIVHYLIVQNLMHGSEIVPLERDRMIDGLVDILTAKANATQPE